MWAFVNQLCALIISSKNASFAIVCLWILLACRHAMGCDGYEDCATPKIIIFSHFFTFVNSRTEEIFNLIDINQKLIAKSDAKFKKVMADYETVNFIYLLLFDGQPELYKEQ